MEFYGNEDSRRFQSTLPQGERRGHRPFCDHFGDFNPRSHKGSDLSRRPWVDDRDISIHAPTRGATGVDVSMFSLMDTFQSTLPQGERPVRYLPNALFRSFQSTLPQGERRNGD